MPELIEKLVARLPLDFRVLYRQFLLRVIDLESLSIEADVTGFLGQFAGVLIMLSLVHSLVTYLGFTFITEPMAHRAFCWHMEHYLISTMMLVIGLITVVSWESTFPDRRDVMVLLPLPVKPRTILLAKITASCAVLGLAILTLNIAAGVVLPFFFGLEQGATWGFLRTMPAYWLTITAASAFLYGSIVAIQGFTSLVLPRRSYLRFSAAPQLAAFGIFLGVYFVEPSITAPAEILNPQNHWILAASPTYWFWALFNQLNGTLPAQLGWVASRAWMALALSIEGATAALLLCYVHTMKKTVEEPDLVPGGGAFSLMPPFGTSLHTAIAHFSLRSLTRSRQHRVALALYLSFVFGLALSLLRGELAAPAPVPVSMDLLISTFLMLFFAVCGLRNVCSLPISLTANWVLRTTQLQPTSNYVAATRRMLQLLAVVPVWLISLGLSFKQQPALQAAGHLIVLALTGAILVEIALLGFYKVPFTCSILPGKTNVQLVFWGSLICLVVLVVPMAEFELDALHNPRQFALTVALLFTSAIALLYFNRRRAANAILYFEELPDPVITTLGIASWNGS